jgi:tetratricopeptide (TPR) repeat protein
MTPEEKAQSKILDPTPQRKRYVIDLLYKFFTKDITYAQLTGIPQKELFQLAEIGHVKLTYGRTDEAKRIFECLIKIDPRNFYYHAALGSVYQKVKKFVEAVFEYTEAMRYNPDDLASLVNRGEIYLLHKNYRKAAEDFRNAILKDPTGRNNYANRARSLVIAIKRNIQLEKQKPKPGVSAPQQTPAMPRGPSPQKAIPRRTS